MQMTKFTGKPAHTRKVNSSDFEMLFIRQLGNDVIEMYEEGLISPHVSAVFPLEQVNDAIEFLHQRKSTGKVILKVR